MNDSKLSVAARDYLARLEKALKPLPREERADIVNETRSHFCERRAAEGDAAVEAAMAAMGKADAYARQFLRNRNIDRAVASNSGLRMMSQSLRLATTGLEALFGFALFAVQYLVIAVILFVGVYKAINPGSVGLWLGRPGFPLFFLGDPGPVARANADEALGFWLVPICGFLAVGLYLGTTRLLKRFLLSFKAKI